MDRLFEGFGELVFIDVSKCNSEEHEVLTKAFKSNYRPDLPWSDSEDVNAISSSSEEAQNKYTSFKDGAASQSTVPHSDFFYSDQPSNLLVDDPQQASNEMSRAGSETNHSVRTKERRNKKKRPPGYYEQIEQQTAQIQPPPGDVVTYHEVPQQSVQNVNRNINTLPQGIHPQHPDDIRTNVPVGQLSGNFQGMNISTPGQQNMQMYSDKQEPQGMAMNFTNIQNRQVNVTPAGPRSYAPNPIATNISYSTASISSTQTNYYGTGVNNRNGGTTCTYTVQSMPTQYISSHEVKGLPYGVPPSQASAALHLVEHQNYANSSVKQCEQLFEGPGCTSTAPTVTEFRNGSKSEVNNIVQKNVIENARSDSEERLLRSKDEMQPDNRKNVHISSVNITLKEPEKYGVNNQQQESTISKQNVDNHLEGNVDGDMGIAKCQPNTSDIVASTIDVPAKEEPTDGDKSKVPPNASSIASPMENVTPNTSEASSNVENTLAIGTEPKQDEPVVPVKPSSWAGLFKGSKSQQSPGLVVYCEAKEPEVQKKETDNLPIVAETETVAATDDRKARDLAVQLSTFNANHRGSPLQPRGLINRGNWCYINATLQALLACPPFFHLLKSLPTYRSTTNRGPSSTPILDSLVEFMHEFKPYTQLKVVEKEGSGKHKHIQEIASGPAFEPSYVYRMLQKLKTENAFKHGKQEDAEEFLSCILNGIHDEMSAALALLRPKIDTAEQNGEVHEETEGSSEETDVHDEWEQVGPKKKTVVTRSADFMQSPISDIFCGQTRSVLSQIGLKESATLQPFFTLQLDIQAENVFSIEDALGHLVSKESLQDYTCVKTKQEVPATRKVTLEHLPPVLVLHSKCFVYDSKSGSSQKLVKQIQYDVDLEIGKELLSPSVKATTNQRTYKLFAVIYHQGKKVSGGHYITDVYHGGINGWIRLDDGNVNIISTQTLLKFVPPRVPYLLYYRRIDLIKGRS